MDTLYTARFHGFPNMSRNAVAEPSALTEDAALSLLVVLGSSISLVALVFAFITYSLFSDLRNLSGTTLMNLLSALFMSQLLYVVGVGGIVDSELCAALAFALQYVRLCVFCWMMLITHNMHNQFRTGLHLVPITDKNIGRNFVKYSLFGWGVPLLLLLGGGALQYREKAGHLLDTDTLKGRGQNCWFLDGGAFLYGLLIPCACFALLTFWYLFRSALLARYIISMQPEPRMRDRMRRKRTLQILLFAKITVYLAGVLSLAAAGRLLHSRAANLLFHAAQGVQGALVALLVTCNCRVLRLYTRSLRSRAARHVGRGAGRAGAATGAAALGSSTSLQLLAWEPPPDAV